MKGCDMLGDNAVYLAKQIASLNLIDMNRDQQISTIQDNKIMVKSFRLAIEDLHSMLFYFMGNHKLLNLYGYKMKFQSIQSIADNLYLIAKDGVIWGDAIRTDFTRIAEDLQNIVNILDHEMTYNMQIVDSRDKNYNRIPEETLV